MRENRRLSWYAMKLHEHNYLVFQSMKLCTEKTRNDARFLSVDHYLCSKQTKLQNIQHRVII
jgi:hypothetical protein